MSQPELIAVLRQARPVAPRELRERVRLIAAEAAVPPRRRITWRRAAVVLVPVAAAIVAAVVLLPRADHSSTAVEKQPLPVLSAGSGAAHAQNEFSLAPGTAKVAPSLPTPSSTRLQRYSASLELRLPSPRAVSDASKRATRIIAALGGYPSSLNVEAGGNSGYANLVLRVPRVHVQVAVSRLAALGRIVNESVSIADLEAQANSTARLIARLQGQLTALQAETQTTQTERQIAALTSRIQSLQRGQAATARTAHYATINLQLTTVAPAAPAQRGHGPLHGLGIAFHWLWIGAVYVVALGAPLVALLGLVWLAARTARRRREDALLSRS
jgi:hypothetical protein